jgi:hypothetical protein
MSESTQYIVVTREAGGTRWQRYGQPFEQFTLAASSAHTLNQYDPDEWAVAELNGKKFKLIQSTIPTPAEPW